MKKPCENCKIIYQTSHPKTSKTCSRLCMSEVYKTRFSGKNNPNYKAVSDKTCLLCKKKYFSYNKTRKFCSQSCSTNFRWQNNKKSFNRKFKKIKSKVIKKDFFKKKIFKFIKIVKIKSKKVEKPNKNWKCKTCSIFVIRRHKYCSPACRKKFYEINVVCNFCKKQFIKRPSELKSINNFCSMRCRHANPKLNANWKGGKKQLSSLVRDCDKNKTLIKKILRRDKYTCQQCNQIGGQLEVDHIKKFSLIFDDFIKINQTEKDKYHLLKLAQKYRPFWDERNLQVLCKKCNWDKEVTYRKSLKTLGY